MAHGLSLYEAPNRVVHSYKHLLMVKLRWSKQPTKVDGRPHWRAASYETRRTWVSQRVRQPKTGRP